MLEPPQGEDEVPLARSTSNRRRTTSTIILSEFELDPR